MSPFTFNFKPNFKLNLAPYDATNLLKIKQSELRLYCDLLTQQTHEVKHLLLSLNPSFNNKPPVAATNSASSDKLDSVSKAAQALAKSSDNISEFSFKSDETAVTALTSQTADNNLNKSNGLSSIGPESHSISNQTSNQNDSDTLENIKVILFQLFFFFLDISRTYFSNSDSYQESF